MRSLRILHLHGRYCSMGGAETYLRLLVRGQRRRGHRVEVAYLDDRRRGVEEGVRFLPASHGLRTALRHWRQYRTFIAGMAPDLIHLHGVQYDLSPLLFPRLAAMAPLVLTVHDTLGLCFKPARAGRLEDSARILPDGTPCTYPMGLRCLRAGCMAAVVRGHGKGWAARMAEAIARRRALRSTARQIVNSRFLRDDLLRNGFRDSRIRIVRPAFEPPPSGSWPAPVEHAGDRVVVLYVGRLARIKGIFQLVEALRAHSDLPWVLWVVGEGEARDELESVLGSGGLGERVHLFGAVPRDELGRFYSQADLLVLPSLCPESWGLVGPEAMAFGLPVVAYASGAIPEWLADGETGRLVGAGDVEALGAALAALIRDLPERRRLAEEARRRVGQWQEEDHLRALEQVYRELLED